MFRTYSKRDKCLAPDWHQFCDLKAISVRGFRLLLTDSPPTVEPRSTSISCSFKAY
uniref:Uncharacterized protein n=1 Tax=Meloidogyne floridensis TaxID=298350 RepID=A0A915NBR9_9BILA